jgi:glycosyltransferase involved in cell wall biosynthesis
MPVYNSSRYLAEAVDSVVAQTFTDWELIAVDDCSTDDSPRMLQAYAEKDSRIRVHRNSRNLRVGATLDEAVRHARGRYIARMDADDVCYPERLETQLRFLERHPDVVAVGGQVVRVDEEGRELGTKTFPTDPGDLYEMMFLSVPIQHPTLVVDTKLLPDGFTWYDGWPCGEDSNLFFKLTQYGKLANVDAFVLKYRYVLSGNLLKDPRATFMSTYRARKLALNRYGYRATLRGRLISKVQFAGVHLIPNRMIPRAFDGLRMLMLRMGMHQGSPLQQSASGGRKPDGEETGTNAGS